MLKSKEQYLREVYKNKSDVTGRNEYPYNLPAVESLNTIEFHPNVTFLIGENGSGKSTILEAIAVAFGYNPEGGTKNFNFATENSHSPLFNEIRLVKSAKSPKDGFFLRAESFYNVASYIDELDRDYGNASKLIQSYGGKSLHQQSHGESFLTLFMNRLSGKGLYILDEPEAALSPNRQMALLSRMHDLVLEDSQFIIATHSPILMAYPNACIYSVDQNYDCVKYEDTEHYNVTKQFLNNTERMLKILMT
ncbi:AAA family ATPase [Fusibacter sp. 3D3]|uniref:AAA family ATPase n=1 Tax=Fusibacter sp. 3D3 TaxID=1048380 RepID=UPI000853EDCA|nr:AAA family ATPase [Fusibacter sp. 3D3]GAU77007.1 ABC transporter, ATP-binding protein [Fusibacter sp. 3D3]